MQQLLTVTKARYIDGYRIEAVFINGIKKMIDFAPIIQRARHREETGRRGVLQALHPRHLYH